MHILKFKLACKLTNNSSLLTLNMKRIHLVPIIQELGINHDNLLEALIREFCRLEGVYYESIDKPKMLNLKKTLIIFKCKFRSKLQKNSRTFSRLLEHEQTWLNKDVTVDKKNFAAGLDRKSKNWEDLGDRSTRSKVIINKLSSTQFEKIVYKLKY